MHERNGQAPVGRSPSPISSDSILAEIRFELKQLKGLCLTRNFIQVGFKAKVPRVVV